MLFIQLQVNRLSQYLVLNLQFLFVLNCVVRENKMLIYFCLRIRKAFIKDGFSCFVTHVGIVKTKPIGIDQSKHL